MGKRQIANSLVSTACSWSRGFRSMGELFESLGTLQRPSSTGPASKKRTTPSELATVAQRRRFRGASAPAMPP